MRQAVRTARRQRRFLEALERGSSVTEAATYASVGRSTVYFWQSSDEEFKASWVEAEGRASGAIMRRAWDLAMGGNTRLLLWFLERTERLEAVVASDEGGDVSEVVIIGADQALGEGEGDGEFFSFDEA